MWMPGSLAEPGMENCVSDFLYSLSNSPHLYTLHMRPRLAHEPPMGSQSQSSTEVSTFTLDSRQPNGLSKSAEPSRSGNHQPRGANTTLGCTSGSTFARILMRPRRVSIQHQSPYLMFSFSASSGLSEKYGSGYR